MVRRLLVVSLSVLLLGSGCGSSASPDGSEGTAGDAKTGAATPEESAGSSAVPGGTYFTRTETDEINVVAAKVSKAGAHAAETKRVKACNKAADRGVKPYRACLHKLLDPFATELGALATVFGTLAGRELPAECVESLGKAQVTYIGLKSQVEELLAGFDSDERKSQDRSAQKYYKTLDTIGAAYPKPFQEMTQVCYSPEDLASINASPSPSP